MNAAYVQSQALTLEAERAFEELYHRLSRWTREALENDAMGRGQVRDECIEKSITVLGFMDRLIDVSGNYEIATAVLNLHRFAVGCLIRAKVEKSCAPLDGVADVFVSLAEIFALMTSQAAMRA